MSEQIRFPSVEEKKEQETKERLKNEAGIFYESEKDPTSGENRNYINILGIKLETYASKEDIEEIKNEIILSKLDQRLLRKIAECYSLKQALLFEGDPGAGKTFLFKKFVKMIHGKDAPVLDLVGTPRTSELEILGHWSPKGLDESEAEEYQQMLRKYMSSEIDNTPSEEFNHKLNNLNKKLASGEINEDQFHDEFGSFTTQYIGEQKKQLMNIFQSASMFKKDVQWEFKEGALLKAYAGNKGKGYILIVDEFNIIPSNYQQIFLQIGGENGNLSKSVSFWGNSGKTVYNRGKNCWICFASNFPEKTPGRSEVVAPMSDRLVWQVLPEEEYKEKKKAIKRTAGGRLQSRKNELFSADTESLNVPVESGIVWDKVLEERLGEQIADIVDILDEEFVQHYSRVGDSISIQGDKRRRAQQMEFSGRNPLRIFSYLDHFQVRDSKTGLVDFTKTLQDAFETYYVGRLYDKDAREKMRKLFNEILTGDTGKIKVKIKQTFATQVEGILSGGKNQEEVKTRKEFLDDLVVSIGKKETEEIYGTVIVSDKDGIKKSLESIFDDVIKISEEDLSLTDEQFKDKVSDLIKEFGVKEKNKKTKGTKNENAADVLVSSMKEKLSKVFGSKKKVIINLYDQFDVIAPGRINEAKKLASSGIKEPIFLLSAEPIKFFEENLPEVMESIKKYPNIKIVQLGDEKSIDLLAEPESFKQKVDQILEGQAGIMTKRRRQLVTKAMEGVFINKNTELIKNELLKEREKAENKDKNAGMVVLSEDGPIKAALEQVFEKLFEMNGLVIMNLSQQEEIGNGDKIKQLEKLVDAGIKEPIILLGFSTLEKLKSKYPKLEDIFNKNDNIKFFQQPLDLPEVVQECIRISKQKFDSKKIEETIEGEK